MPIDPEQLEELRDYLLQTFANRVRKLSAEALPELEKTLCALEEIHGEYPPLTTTKVPKSIH
jgi:hypothetical protein